MAVPSCDPYPVCEDLDGRLLIRRTYQGPPLTFHEGVLPFGPFGLTACVLRPYVTLSFLQRWVPLEPCLGPVQSVMGLAPTESVTVDVRERRQVDYESLFTRAAETSRVTTTTERTRSEFIDIGALRGGGGGGGGDWLDGILDAIKGVGDPIGASGGPIGGLIADVAEAVAEKTGGPAAGVVDLLTEYIDAFGSPFLSGVGAIAGGALGFAVGGPVGGLVGAYLGEQVGGYLDNEFGGAGGGGAPPQSVQDVLTTVDETLETVEVAESQQTVTQTSTRRSTVRQRSVTRTFSNPYRDRSLELRFMPVFRRFEVLTYPIRALPGLALNVGGLQVSDVGVNAGHVMAARALDPSIAQLARAELGVGPRTPKPIPAAVKQHVQANASAYTRRLLRDAADRRNVDWLQRPLATLLVRQQAQDERQRRRPLTQALVWSQATAQEESILVPLAAPETVAQVWDLKGKARKKLVDSMRALSPDRISALVPKPHRRVVHVFVGTHVEAAPGHCVLPDVPSPA